MSDMCFIIKVFPFCDGIALEATFTKVLQTKTTIWGSLWRSNAVLVDILYLVKAQNQSRRLFGSTWIVLVNIFNSEYTLNLQDKYPGLKRFSKNALLADGTLKCEIDFALGV